MNDSPILHAVEREHERECFLTAHGGGQGLRGAAARALLVTTYGRMALERIEPIQELLFGASEAREELLSLRREALQAAGLPERGCTFVSGAPLRGTGLAGLRLWGLARRADGPPLVEDVLLGGGLRGRAFRLAGTRLFFVPSLRARAAEGAQLASAYEAILTQAEEALRAGGLTLRELVRTWFYLRRLLVGYDAFNEVRSRRYRAAGVLQAGGRVPASTGIEGHDEGSDVLLELLAAEPGGGLAIEPVLATRRQGTAISYGSSFARAVALVADGRRTVHVSGTAAIAGSGESQHRGDAEAQNLATLVSVAALLEEQGGRLDGVLSGTLFCKEPAVYDAFVRVTRQLGLPVLPVVPVLADVCRDDLLVELEAVAQA